MKFPNDSKDCFRVDTVDGCVDHAFLGDYPIDHLEKSLVNPCFVEKHDSRSSSI